MGQHVPTNNTNGSRDVTSLKSLLFFFGIPSNKRNLTKFNKKIWNIQASVQFAFNLIASFGSKDDFLWDVAHLLFMSFLYPS